MSRTPVPERDGRTALAVVVPETESLVGSLRARFDSSAPRGMPAHVTVLFPFVPLARWDASIDARLDALFAAHAAFDVRFRDTGRFGTSVLWLAPEPPAPFVALTRDIERAFPDFPAYGGAFADPIPHLTIAEDAASATPALDEVAAMLPTSFDVRTRVDRVTRFGHVGGRWTPQREHLLQGVPR